MKDDVKDSIVFMHSHKTQIILQIIIITLIAAFVVYYVLGSFEYVHIVAFGIICAGVGYAVYLNRD
jgi:1,4-dihydroxy-2-naphthoate octaprenyltransferase